MRPRVAIGAAIVVSAALVPVGLGRGVGAAASPEREKDSLSPELRAKVERLKTEVAAEPTTDATLAERTTVLWEWGNACSRAGGVVPHHLAFLVWLERTLPEQLRGASPRLDAGKELDMLVRDLAAKDEVPGAVGTLVLGRAAPLVARSWEETVQTWTVGALPMKEGGHVYLGKDGYNNCGSPQGTDPAGDNYVTVRASAPGARFVYAGVGERGMPQARVLASFRLEGASLKPGDVVTIVYGDRSGGSRGFEIQGSSVSRLMLPVYLDLEGGGATCFQPEWPGVEVVGMPEVAAVRGFAPSIVAPGERFAVAVRSEDRLYNRASGPIPAYRVLVNGREHSTIPAGTREITMLEGLSFDEPGVYRFTFESSDGRVFGSANPVWVRRDPPLRIYWGDTHGHISICDGQGTVDGYYTFARDDARLDFVALSNHDWGLEDGEWLGQQELIPKYREGGAFVPMLGFEWSGQLQNGGHNNVYYRNLGSARLGGQIAPKKAGLLQEVARRFRPGDALVIPHAHAPGDWRIGDDQAQRLVEINSQHGTFEWFGNRFLQQGWEVGFIGSSDNHSEHPGWTGTMTTFHTQLGGLAAVLAGERTNDAIFAALYDRRAYATTGGARIILDAELNGAAMGTRLPAGGERRLKCRAIGAAPIDAIDVVKNGEVVFTKRYLGGGLAPRCWVRVGFESSSEVPGYLPPRSNRTWSGSLKVDGARIVEVRPATLEDHYLESAAIAEDDPRTVDFSVLTRGRLDALMLELDGVSQETSIAVEVVEQAGEGRRPAVPAVAATFRLGEAVGGLVRHEIPSGAADTVVDALSVQIFDPAESLDQEFEYSDRSDFRPGDYYYLRVTQVDGEMAWSSPWWVGGEPRQK